MSQIFYKKKNKKKKVTHLSLTQHRFDAVELRKSAHIFQTSLFMLRGLLFHSELFGNRRTFCALQKYGSAWGFLLIRIYYCCWSKQIQDGTEHHTGQQCLRILNNLDFVEIEDDRSAEQHKRQASFTYSADFTFSFRALLHKLQHRQVVSNAYKRSMLCTVPWFSVLSYGLKAFNSLRYDDTIG